VTGILAMSGETTPEILAVSDVKPPFDPAERRRNPAGISTDELTYRQGMEFSVPCLFAQDDFEEGTRYNSRRSWEENRNQRTEFRNFLSEMREIQ